jgi:predicted ATPase
MKGTVWAVNTARHVKRKEELKRKTRNAPQSLARDVRYLLRAKSSTGKENSKNYKQLTTQVVVGRRNVKVMIDRSKREEKKRKPGKGVAKYTRKQTKPENSEGKAC